MIHQSYLQFKSITVKKGETAYLQIPDGNFIRCTKAPGIFYIKLDTGDEMPFMQGFRWTLRDGDTFTNLAVRNPSASVDIVVEFFHGYGDLADDTLNVIDPVASGLVIKSPPKMLSKNYSSTGMTEGESASLDSMFTLPQNAQVSHYIATNAGKDQGTGEMKVGDILIPEGTSVEIRTSKQDLLLDANTRWSIACFFF